MFFFSFFLAPHSMWDITSLTRDWTQASAEEVQSLNHWTTREVPENVFLYSFKLVDPYFTFSHLKRFCAIYFIITWLKWGRDRHRNRVSIPVFDSFCRPQQQRGPWILSHRAPASPLLPSPWSNWRSHSPGGPLLPALGSTQPAQPSRKPPTWAQFGCYLDIPSPWFCLGSGFLREPRSLTFRGPARSSPPAPRGARSPQVPSCTYKQLAGAPGQERAQSRWA